MDFISVFRQNDLKGRELDQEFDGRYVYHLKTAFVAYFGWWSVGKRLKITMSMLCQKFSIIFGIVPG